MRVSIGWLLVLSFLGLIWGTHFITSTSQYLSSEAALEQHARDIMSRVALHTMERSRNYLGKALTAADLTKRLLNSVVLSEEKAEVLEQYFLDQLALYPDVAGIYFGLPNGDFYYVSRNASRDPKGFRTKLIRQRASGRSVSLVWRNAERAVTHREETPEDPYDPRQRPWYKAVMASGRITWTRPYLFYTSQKPGITISGPSLKPDGGLRGVVGVDIEIDQLSTFMAQLRVGRTGKAFMINRDREVVAFPDPAKLRQVDAKTGKASANLTSIERLDDVLSRKAFGAIEWGSGNGQRLELAEQHFAKFEHEGCVYSACFTPFPDNQWPWIIGVYLPEEDYLGAIREDYRRNYLLTAVISILATVIAFFISKRISVPLQHMRAVARAVRENHPAEGGESEEYFAEIAETVRTMTEMNARLSREMEERQRAEESLEENERMYEMIAHHVDDVVWAMDPMGRFTYLSPAAERMLGVPVPEIIERGITDFMSEEDAERLRSSLVRRQMEEPEGGLVSCYQLFHRNGTCFDIEVNSAMIYDESGQPSGFMGVTRDISERKQAEEALVQAERMAAVGTLAGGVAHEFNNIHTSVLGFGELAMMGVEEGSEIHGFLEKIKVASLRAKALTQNLLTFSRKRSGGMCAADLGQVVEETLSLVRSEFMSEGIGFCCDLQEVPKPYMDSAQIGQVVLNLLINARHAMLGTSPREIEVQLGAGEGKVYLSVSDTGCGIAPEAMRKVFTPFYSTKGEYAEVDSPQASIKGAGLGLSICHTIMSNHQGRIEVTSEVGKGSTFTLWLPTAESAEPGEDAPAIVAAETPTTKGGRVLIVEDEAHVRDIVSLMLGRRGVEVEQADEETMALARVRSGEIDLVLLDLQLPKADGFAILKSLQEDPGEGVAPIVVVTGRCDEATLDRCLSLGAHSTLSKPFEMEELMAVVDAILPLQP
ncbi:MAG: ATP-binding protein [Planctomycetota bacterium]